MYKAYVYSLITCCKAHSRVTCTQVKKQIIASTPRASPLLYSHPYPPFSPTDNHSLDFYNNSFAFLCCFATYVWIPKGCSLVLPVFEIYINGIILYWQGGLLYFVQFYVWKIHPVFGSSSNWFIHIHNTELYSIFSFRITFFLQLPYELFLWVVFWESLGVFKDKKWC